METSLQKIGKKLRKYVVILLNTVKIVTRNSDFILNFPRKWSFRSLNCCAKNGTVGKTVSVDGRRLAEDAARQGQSLK
jgi:hypothetical protein